jgi:hypothetical protein
MPKLPSFTRFIQNVVPNFANDAKHDVDMTPAQMDGLLSFQLVCQNPRFLKPASFGIAGITDNESTARRLYQACVKHGYIAPEPGSDYSLSRAASTSSSLSAGSPSPASASSPMTVNTNIIDRHLPSRLAMVSVHAQRKLVALLFFWEEECTRWRALDEQEWSLSVEIQGAAADAARAAELQTLLESVRRRKTLLPSQRAEGAGGVFPPREEDLPVYREEGRQ